MSILNAEEQKALDDFNKAFKACEEADKNLCKIIGLRLNDIKDKKSFAELFGEIPEKSTFKVILYQFYLDQFGLS
jgi:hypothetical protein